MLIIQYLYIDFYFFSNHGRPGDGNDFYYRTMISKMIAAKFPRASIPKFKKFWLATRDQTGLFVTFQNVLEWNLGLKLSGYNDKKVIGCITYQEMGGCELQLSPNMNGTRNVANVPINWAFQPQIFNCKFCQGQHYDQVV